MINLENLIQRIGNVSHFKGLPQAALRDIVYAGQILEYPADSTIFMEGGTAAGMYVIFKGQVHLYKLGTQGQEVIISVVKPVVMFNEITAIDGNPNPVTAVAAQDSTTWRVATQDFQTLMERYPQVGTGLLKIMASRNRLLLSRYEDLLSLPVLARTAKVLLDLSRCGQMPINRYKYPNQKMAALAATVPEAISRSIREFRDKDILDSNRAQISVHSPARLADLAQIEPMIFEAQFSQTTSPAD